MRYRSIHTIDVSRNYTLNDVRNILRFVIPSGASVDVQSKGRNAPVSVTVKFQAASDAMAKQHAAMLRMEAAIIGPSDHQGLQVSTRKGWADLS